MRFFLTRRKPGNLGRGNLRWENAGSTDLQTSLWGFSLVADYMEGASSVWVVWSLAGGPGMSKKAKNPRGGSNQKAALLRTVSISGLSSRFLLDFLPWLSSLMEDMWPERCKRKQTLSSPKSFLIMRFLSQQKILKTEFILAQSSRLVKESL